MMFESSPELGVLTQRLEQGITDQNDRSRTNEHFKTSGQKSRTNSVRIIRTKESVHPWTGDEIETIA